MIRTHWLAGVLASVTLSAHAFSQIIYVDRALTTGAGDGSSWADAFQGSGGVQEALGVAVGGDQVWVSTGLYFADSGFDRTVSLQLSSSVQLYGSLTAGATSLESRPQFRSQEWELAASVLSGDLQSDDDGTPFTLFDNTRHIVWATSDSVLDGFRIEGGNAASANNPGPYNGGGMLCYSSSSPTIRNCSFTRNRAVDFGGAVHCKGSSPSFINCDFIENLSANQMGGVDLEDCGDALFDRCRFMRNEGVYCGALNSWQSTDVKVRNSLFVDNRASFGFGAILKQSLLPIPNLYQLNVANCTFANNLGPGSAGVIGGDVLVTNCVVWDNIGQAVVSQDAAVNYSIVEGGFSGGTGNLMSDPQFVDPGNLDYSVKITSPAIDAGDNGAWTGSMTSSLVDFRGSSRFYDVLSVPDTGAGAAPIVDMGYTEFTANVGYTYCAQSVLNSIGGIAQMNATGSPSLAANNLTVVAAGMPMNTFGYFLVARDAGFVANVGGSRGNLCLGGAIGRYVGATQIGNTGTTDRFELSIDLTSIPQPTGFVPTAVGETWRFQAWHRDSFMGVSTSSFTDGLAITIES